MEHGKYYSLDSRESLAFIDYSPLASSVIESNLLFLLHNRPMNWKDKVLRQWILLYLDSYQTKKIED